MPIVNVGNKCKKYFPKVLNNRQTKILQSDGLCNEWKPQYETCRWMNERMNAWINGMTEIVNELLN